METKLQKSKLENKFIGVPYKTTNMHKTALAFLIAVIIPIGFYFAFDSQGIPEKRRLQRFYPLPADSQQANKVSFKDTLWHTIPDFSFTTQSGDTFTSEDAKDKILIVGFFAGHDEERLASMNEYYKMLQEEFIEDKEVFLVAHTVVPSIDTLARLQQLVQKYKIDDEKWFLLGGSQEDVYNQIEKGYRLPLPELSDSSGLENLIYPSKYVLVGRKGIIRGYYDLESLEDLRIFMSDIRWMQLEYPTKHKREIEWKLKERKES